MICLAINSCANLGDLWVDLGNGFIYKRDGRLRWITRDNIMKEKIYPNILDYAFDDNYIIIVQEPEMEGYNRVLAEDLCMRYESIIYPLIKPEVDSATKFFLKSHLWTDSSIHERVVKEIKPDYHSDFTKLQLIADSIIKFDPYYLKQLSRKRNYWIINKKKDIIFGPFSKVEYLRMRNQFKISETLFLKDE